LIDLNNINLSSLSLILARIARGPCSPSTLQQFRHLTDYNTLKGYLDFLSKGEFIVIRSEDYRQSGPVKLSKTIEITARGRALLKEVESLLKFLSLGEDKEEGFSARGRTYSEIMTFIRQQRNEATEIVRDFKYDMRLLGL
jgi:DNA-binding PadR family transcriptional regulator